MAILSPKNVLVTMIIGIDLCEIGKESIKCCPYNNSKHQPLDISIELNNMKVMFISLCVWK